MANNSIRFACSAMAGSNKVGNIKRDEKGYYPLVVGALDMFNSAGQFYVYEQAKELFKSSSQFMRRVSNGALRGECGHPKQLPGMSNEQYANRVMSVYEDNTCCHHKEITLDFDNVKDENGRPVIAIISKVMPSGPMGPALEKSLNNPDENVCFSIRAFTDDYRERGITKRVLKTIVTFDQVTEPGISVANKFKSPALESLEEDGMVITRGEIERSMVTANRNGLATESVIMTADDLWRNMGWDSSSMIDIPSYMKW
jgi:hypothetical protein